MSEAEAVQEETAVAVAGPSDSEGELDLGLQVQLSAFSGPLDLLLHLVRKAEVDIAEVSIIAIADQFLSIVENWEDTDLEMAGDFILMAATLLEIKARSIVPPVETEEGADEEDDWIDPRADLVRQLLAFRKTKDAVQWLEDLENDRLRLHHRRLQESIPEDPSEADGIDLDNADPYALFTCWEKILAAIAGNRQRTVVYDDIPIDDRVKKIEAVMSSAREAQLAWLLTGEEKPIARVGVVIASLEALRKRVIEAHQHEQYGPVYLHYLDPDQREWAPLQAESTIEEAPRRRRRRPPLITWRSAEGLEAEVDEDAMPAEEPEVQVESDEQRFLRELNEQCQVDEVLARVREMDAHLKQRLIEAGVIAEEDAISPSAEVLESAEATADEVQQP